MKNPFVLVPEFREMLAENNLNITIKFLTSITIIITIPGTIAGFFGMNVKIPFQEHPNGFIFVMIMSLVLSIAAILVFVRKKWL
jgi:Mg2+ and Co2+ transporters